MKTSRAKKSKSLDNKSATQSSKGKKNKRVYCLCKGHDDGRFMIGCDSCNDWFHVGCVGMTKTAAKKLKAFTCPLCSTKNKDNSTDAAPADEVKETTTTTKPKRIAKRTNKASTTSVTSAKRRKKNEDGDEEDDASEESSEHNESEVEDDDEDSKERDDDDDDDEEGKEEHEDEEEVEEEEKDEEESSYEQERKRRMEENQQFLRSLGLLDVKKTLAMSSSASSASGRKYSGKRHRWSAGDASDKGDDSFEGDDEVLAKSSALGPVRKSRRLQNEPALDFSQIKKEVVQELADRPVFVRSRGRGAVFALSRGFHGNGRVPGTEHIVAPLSLASIGTTIWSLGRIYEGDASPEKYFSSKQCMYRHPYPVGYRASIVKWGSVWIMEINEGADGPRFVVRQKRDDEDEDGTPLTAQESEEEDKEKNETAKGEEKGHESFDGEEEQQQEEGEGERQKSEEDEPQKKKRNKTYKRFEGPSATQPWTKACITGPSPGSRVSGPLLFGFSDPLTVHVLNCLRKQTSSSTSAQSE